ncbi:MAG: MFS transporter [Chloroflexota bacterium]|nr:MFS transporter [Chloroflexota bacterium]
MSFLRVLSKPTIAVLWGGQVLSAIGDHLFLIAIMWLAVKQAGSAAGIVTAAGALSALLFGLFGGVFADRWDRRLTLIGVDILRALAVGILPVLAWLGNLQLWHLVVAAIVVETLDTLFGPALQASIPLLIADSKTLYTVNGLMDATQRFARVLGPGMAGALLLVLPLVHFFTLDAISFCMSALALSSLGRHFPWQPLATDATEPASDSSLFAHIRGALQLLRTHQTLSWMLVSLGLVNMAWSAAFTVGVPLLTNQSLGGSAGIYGLIVGVYGVGNIISLFIGNLAIGRRLITMFIGEIVLGVGFLLLASATNVGVALLGSAIAAIGSPLGDLILLTLIQVDFPAGHIGKIYSVRMLIGGTGLMLGSLLAVPLFHLFSIPVSIALCAIFIMSIGVAGVIRFRTRR